MELKRGKYKIVQENGVDIIVLETDSGELLVPEIGDTIYVAKNDGSKIDFKVSKFLKWVGAFQSYHPVEYPCGPMQSSWIILLDNESPWVGYLEEKG